MPFKKLFGRKNVDRQKAKRRTAQPRPPARTFYAVTVRYSESQACDAVRALGEKPFLSSEAPNLPLDDCDRPHLCRCQYRHQPDRRSLLRRDTDHGLPGRFYEGAERRSGLGNRRRESMR